MMKTYLKRAFQLSDSGVKGLAKSIWSFFLYYVSFVPPMICVFLFADRLLNGNTGKPVVYLLFMLAATLVMYLVINYNYKTTYDETYYENVRIGNSQATRQQIMDALDAANCTSILDKFPQREMTVIGAKGVYLSGGEVQRIAIARAILKNANIVIMDEASAAADPENEYELQQAFQKLMRGKTVIMIAHRLSSIQNVDQILFVQNGKVVEQGTHNELMACNGRYKDFQDVYCKANQWRLA